jgi:hypothetical protein
VPSTRWTFIDHKDITLFAAHQLTTSYLKDAITGPRQYKKLADSDACMMVVAITAFAGDLEDSAF